MFALIFFNVLKFYCNVMGSAVKQANIEFESKFSVATNLQPATTVK